MSENRENQQTQPQGEAQAAPPVPFEISVLPLQQTTLFPETVIPLSVGRPRSMTAVEAALATEEKLLACITLRKDDVTGQEATPADLYDVGTLVMIKRMMRDEEVMQLIVQGTERIRVLEWTQEQPCLRARVEILPPLTVVDPEEVEALKRNMQGLIQQALAMLPQVPPEVRMAVMSSDDPVRLAYFLASVLNLGVEQE
ncbi:MAG TPA: LON peptidase substrate-binding domain-containing protein, partial [Pyrinomonadaceae bacterium]|nr:LON peptidase substrate-binding domain-containing protein [Pyrinomonadaceae bacterium]